MERCQLRIYDFEDEQSVNLPGTAAMIGPLPPPAVRVQVPPPALRSLVATALNAHSACENVSWRGFEFGVILVGNDTLKKLRGPGQGARNSSLR